MSLQYNKLCPKVYKAVQNHLGTYKYTLVVTTMTVVGRHFYSKIYSIQRNIYYNRAVNLYKIYIFLFASHIRGNY